VIRGDGNVGIACSAGECDRDCDNARLKAENSGDRNIYYRHYSTAEQMASPNCCVHCGSENIDMTHFEFRQDGNKIIWIEDWQCGSCFEPEFREVTEFICPRLLKVGL
jgi:hypothetical protein